MGGWIIYFTDQDGFTRRTDYKLASTLLNLKPRPRYKDWHLG